MDEKLLEQLWQALYEAETPYDYSIIFKYLLKKEIDSNGD